MTTYKYRFEYTVDDMGLFRLSAVDSDKEEVADQSERETHITNMAHIGGSSAGGDGRIEIHVSQNGQPDPREALDMADAEINKINTPKQATSRKKILDATCGSRTIWFNKRHPSCVYCDKRQEVHFNLWRSTNRNSERTCIIDPDVVCDFTALPFDNDTFSLVIFDPPHLSRAGDTSWLVKKYGRLDDNWPRMLHDGFAECMRVLKPDGVLIFKWAETDIPAASVWKAIGEKPLFGHHSGKKSKTFWGCFMKLVD